jgi:hypothetical protein
MQGTPPSPPPNPLLLPPVAPLLLPLVPPLPPPLVLPLPPLLKPPPLPPLLAPPPLLPPVVPPPPLLLFEPPTPPVSSDPLHAVAAAAPHIDTSANIAILRMIVRLPLSALTRGPSNSGKSLALASRSAPAVDKRITQQGD